jgi:hypothetical protein
VADRIQLLLEAERRGILPADRAPLLAEARRRGLIPGDSPATGSSAAAQDTAAWEQQIRSDLTGGISGVQKFMAGAGKSVADLGRGVRQLGAEGMALVTGDRGGADALRAEQDDTAARDAALMSTGAGVAGNVAGTLASTLVPASVLARGAQAANLGRTAAAARGIANPTTYKAAIGTGATLGALAPVGADESRAQNMLVGGALGAAGNLVANTAGRIAQPIKQALTKEDRAAVKVLDKAGVPLDIAQRSGSKAATIVKRTIDDNPFTQGGQRAFAEKQQQAFTKAVLKTIGEEADAATAEVMGNAQKRIGKVFDDVAERNPVKYDGQLHADLTSTYQQAARELTSPDAAVINRQLEEVFTKAQEGDGKIIGKAYQNIKSSLDRIIKGGDSKGYWAGQMKDAIEEALQRSASKEDLQALKTARAQYRRMKQIEGAIDNEGGGIISPAKLSNALGTKANRAQSKYGRGDQELVVLAQAGKKLLPDKFPNSGTPARIAAQLVAPGAIGLGAGYASGDAGAGLATGVGTAGALLGARYGMNNQAVARALTEGLPEGAIRNLLAAPRRAGLLRTAPAVALPAIQE